METRIELSLGGILGLAILFIVVAGVFYDRAKKKKENKRGRQPEGLKNE